MSFSRSRSSRLAGASLAAALGAVAAAPNSEAREGHRYNAENNIPELSSPSRHGFEEIIVRIPAMRPAPGYPAKVIPAPAYVKAAKATKEAAKEPAKDVPLTKYLDLKPGEHPAAAAPAAAEGPPAAAGVDAPKEVAKDVAKDSATDAAKDGAPKAGDAAAPAPVAANAPVADKAADAASVLDVKPQGAKVDAKVQDAKIQDMKSDAKPQEAKAEAKAQDGKADAKVQDAKAQDGKAQDGKPQDGKPAVEAPAQAPIAQAPATPEAKPSVEAAAPVDAKLQDAKLQDGKLQDGKPQDAKDQQAKPSVEAAAPSAEAAKAGAPAAQTDAAQAYAALLAQGARGPIEVRLADRATLWLPAGRVYLEGALAREALGAGKNWDAATLGVVLPTGDSPEWTAYVSLIDDGYIRDDKGKALDPVKTLAAYKAAVATDNLDRQMNHLPLLEATDWMEAPRYDAKHHLSSCIGVTTAGSLNPADKIVNCGSFALGAQGALKVVVAGDEEVFARFSGEAASLADAIVHDHGKAYEDADPATVKMAPYGLVAMMTGGFEFRKPAIAKPVGVARQLGVIGLLVLYAIKFGKMALVVVAMAAASWRWLKRFRKPAPANGAVREAVAKPAEDRPFETIAPEAPAAAPAWKRVALDAVAAARSKFAHGQAAPKVEIGTPVESAAQARAKAQVKSAVEKSSGGVAAKLAGNLAALREKLPFAAKPVDAKPAFAPPRGAAPIAGSAPSEAKSALVQPEGAKPESTKSTPAAALAKVAALMRKNAPEEPRPVINLARVERRQLPGAAPNDVERRVAETAPASSVAASEPVAAHLAPVEAPAPAMDDFALIEPGDEAAAAAREALRRANG